METQKMLAALSVFERQLEQVRNSFLPTVKSELEDLAKRATWGAAQLTLIRVGRREDVDLIKPLISYQSKTVTLSDPVSGVWASTKGGKNDIDRLGNAIQRMIRYSRELLEEHAFGKVPQSRLDGEPAAGTRVAPGTLLN